MDYLLLPQKPPQFSPILFFENFSQIFFPNNFRTKNLAPNSFLIIRKINPARGFPLAAFAVQFVTLPLKRGSLPATGHSSQTGIPLLLELSFAGRALLSTTGVSFLSHLCLF